MVKERTTEGALTKFTREEAEKVQRTREERGYGRFGWREYTLLAGTALILAGALLYFKWCVDYGASQVPDTTVRVIKSITFAGEK